ncbi:MAG: hypothetical protein V7603_611 [Micromonosporaceae bacterium]
MSCLVDRPLPKVFDYVADGVEALGDLVDWQPLGGFTVCGRSKLLRVESKYVFTREPDGTRTSLSLTMDPRGPARLVEPVLRRQLWQSLTVSFDRLATTLETALSP